MLTIMDEERIAPAMRIGNFDRNLFTTKVFISKVIDISPQLAMEFLERVGFIAGHSPSRIKIFAAIIAAGKMKLIHQGIAFNWDGKLVDGYIRLCAIVRAGVTVRMQVTFGLDPADFSVVDTGYTRRGKHALRVSGLPVQTADNMASAIRLYLRYTESLKANKLVPVAQFTPQVITDFMLENEDFTTITEEVLNTKQTWREVMPPAVAIVLAYMAVKKRHSPDVALAFIKGIGNFAGQEERNPILALYKSLNGDKKPRKQENSLVKGIRAFNKWVRFGHMSVVHGIGLRADAAEEGDLPTDTVNLPAIIQYAPNHHRNVNKLT